MAYRAPSHPRCVVNEMESEDHLGETHAGDFEVDVTQDRPADAEGYASFDHFRVANEAGFAFFEEDHEETESGLFGAVDRHGNP